MRNHRIRAALVAACLSAVLLSACSPDEQTPTSAAIVYIADEVVTPSYAEAAEQAQQLNTASQNHCHNSGDLNSLQTHWMDAYLAWQALSVLSFSPLADEQSLRIQFYPDDRGLVVSQTEALLNQNETVTENQIANGSAPTQGFPALEYLLFANATASQRDINSANFSHYCSLVTSISQHLAKRLATLNSDWQTRHANFVTQTDDSLDAIVEAILRHVVAIRDRELGDPLGVTDNGVAAPEKVKSPYAEQSIEASVAALNTILKLSTGAVEPPQFGLAQLFYNNFSTDYAYQLNNLLLAVIEQYDALNLSLKNGVSDANERARLLDLFDGDFRSLRNLLQELPQRTNTSAGFNAGDGD